MAFITDKKISARQCVSLGFEQFQRNLNTFFTYWLITWIPLMIVGLFPEPPGVLNFLFRIIALFCVVFTVLAICAVPLIIESSINGESIEPFEAISISNKRAGWGILMILLSSVIIGLGLVFFIIPGIYLAVIYVFVFPACMLRGCKFSAFSYSNSLVKGRWWQVFFVLLRIGVIFIGVAILLAIVVGILSFFISIISPLDFQTAVDAVDALANFPLTYFSSAVSTILFLKLEQSKSTES